MRCVPPVHSPMPPRALVAGARTLVRSRDTLPSRMARRVREHYGAREVVFTDTGTSALAVALRAAASARADRPTAAIPAYGCYDLVTAVRGAGIRAVPYDLDPRTLSPEPTSLARALEHGATVVVVAHLYGVPVNLDVVGRLVAEAGGTLVEDAAQGVGGAYRGRPLGSHGSLSVLSFGRGKGLTGGGGGALLVNDDVGEEALRAAVDLARPPGRGAARLLAAAAQWMFARPSLYGLPSRLPFLELGETVYRSPHPPAGIHRACLAVLEATWEPSLREAEERRLRAGRLLRYVRAASGLRAVAPPAQGRPGYLRLPVLTDGDATRALLSADRARRLGVMPGYPRPLNRLEAFRDAAALPEPDGTRLPGARRLASRLFTLPVHGRLAPRDLSRLEALISATSG